MSTRFTKVGSQERSPEPLSVLLETARQFVLRSLTARLRSRGYAAVTETHLILFGNLECGATHASQIAQRMGVSRQAISKTLRELKTLGFIHLEDDINRRSQKLVLMTELGRQLATDARGGLLEIELQIAEQIGAGAMKGLRIALEKGWGGAPAE